MPQNRRSFLATLGAVAFGTVTGAAHRPALARAAAATGLQLYTVRDAMEHDMPRTLERVASAGYAEVEFAGYFGRTPREVRVMIDDRGLDSPSVHVAFGDLAGGWADTLEVAAEIGHGYVVVPWVPEAARTTLDDWKRIADAFNAAGAAARDAGLRFAYHNHDFELRPVDDVIPLQLLIDATDPSLVSFELDVYWVARAGHDPLAWLRRTPDRFELLHLKDSSGTPDHRMLDVGAGVIDFPGILAFAAESGVRHCFVEHDDAADAFASIRASRAYLAGLEHGGA
ncbi:MAG: sugar phosphate isomerase/epimerase [Gemmatimonadota bacterium]